MQLELWKKRFSSGTVCKKHLPCCPGSYSTWGSLLLRMHCSGHRNFLPSWLTDANRGPVPEQGTGKWPSFQPHQECLGALLQPGLGPRSKLHRDCQKRTHLKHCRVRLVLSESSCLEVTGSQYIPDFKVLPSRPHAAPPHLFCLVFISFLVPREMEPNK